VEPVDGISEGTAGLNRLVRTGLRAQTAVHADAEVDLVAHLVEAAVLARLSRNENAAIGAGLGARAATRAPLVDPKQARAGAIREVSHFLGKLNGHRRLEEMPQRDHQTFG